MDKIYKTCTDEEILLSHIAQISKIQDNGYVYEIFTKDGRTTRITKGNKNSDNAKDIEVCHDKLSAEWRLYIGRSVLDKFMKSTDSYIEKMSDMIEKTRPRKKDSFPDLNLTPPYKVVSELVWREERVEYLKSEISNMQKLRMGNLLSTPIDIPKEWTDEILQHEEWLAKYKEETRNDAIKKMEKIRQEFNSDLLTEKWYTGRVKEIDHLVNRIRSTFTTVDDERKVRILLDEKDSILKFVSKPITKDSIRATFVNEHAFNKLKIRFNTKNKGLDDLWRVLIYEPQGMIEKIASQVIFTVRTWTTSDVLSDGQRKDHITCRYTKLIWGPKNELTIS